MYMVNQMASALKSRERHRINCNQKTSCSRTVVEERIGSKLVRSYLLDERSNTNAELRTQSPPRNFNLAQASIEFLLPAGFPSAVSEDYLPYMLWQLPTNVTAWICRALITSSLLQAVGISAGPGPTAAAAAAIKWVTKDGLGAVGRLLVGGRFGGVFDEDPKQWRMYADIIGSFGGLFELATPLSPDNFLLLASFGHLTKAVAKGLKDPSFRVIQNHFAVSENVGDVAAKEEVWEVAGQLVGLFLGVKLLSMPLVTTSYTHLAFSWGMLRCIHLWLRYQSLTVLQLPTLNYKRLAVLVTRHVQRLPLAGVADCNQEESLLIPRQFLKPSIYLGCSFSDILHQEASTAQVKKLLNLYSSERYVLVLHLNPLYGYEAKILLKDGWSSSTVLRSIYQAYAIVNFAHNEMTVLSESLHQMQQQFTSFQREVEEVGWNLSKIVVKVPNGAPIYTFLE